jgi:peptidoglycan/LPS O-acetylase OafA/YrhL
MFFYVIFTVFIFLMRGRAVWATAVFLGLGVAVTSLWTPSLLPLDFWFRPIVLEFVCGMFIAVAYGNGYRIPVWIAPILVVIGLCLWSLVDMRVFPSYGGPGFYSFPRFFIFGGGALCMVTAATLIPKWKAPAWLGRVSSLGDSSYTLYLLHPFILLIFRSALPHLHVPPVLYWPVVFIIVASAVILAHLVYLRVETPTMQLLRKRLFAGNVAQPA